jgi:hypothetical protein
MKGATLMKLLLDDDGHAILKDGMPVYRHDDGSEIPLDAAEIQNRVRNLTEEKDRHFKNSQKFQELYKPWEGMELKDVQAAMETVKNLDDAKLLKAEEVEAFKKQLTKAAEEDKAKVVDQFSSRIQELEGTLSGKDKTIHELLITSNFARSPLFTGEDSKTLFTPDMAATVFGKYFQVEEAKDGSVKIVGFLNGEPIQSRKSLGKRPGSMRQ